MESKRKLTDWLPITRDEMLMRGWDEVDVVVISGDAYVDHPAFGSALIARVIENAGFTVAIVPQPNWQDDLRDFRKFGKPRLCFAVSAGNMDSMVNHYTANKRLRSDDAYTPGGNAGFRPDYATIVYTKAAKKVYPDVPVIIGGIEASMRRFAHYDYWSNSLKPSILAESGADLLLYGMAEKSIVEVLKLLEKHIPAGEIQQVPQTVFRTKQYANKPNQTDKEIILPSFEECLSDKKAFALSFKLIETESNKMEAAKIIQKHAFEFVVANPQYPPFETGFLDSVYALPFTRLPHPKYQKRGVVPAYEMIRHSVNIHRGCFGGCAFCTLAMHQGKFISSRSEGSVLQELKEIVKMPDFKGQVSDLGAPSANMYRMQGFDLNICAKCKRPSCIFPAICKNLNYDHKPLTALYQKASAIAGIKKISIGSGVRYDMLLADRETDKKLGLSDYTRQLVKYHVSGRLKVAPEHTSDNVLKLMRKPSFKLFHDFGRVFNDINRKEGLNQQLIPYFISSHPGSTVRDMAHLAAETKDMGFRLEQIQDFTPTPLTLASVMYYTGINPYTGDKVYTAITPDQKLEQRQFFFWYKPEFASSIRKTLQKLGETALLEKLLKRSGGGKKY